MQPIDAGIAILILHGLLRGFAIVCGRARNAPPRAPAAVLALKLHAARSGFYAVLLAGLAWYEWHGGMLVVLAALVLAEFGLTLVDAVVEDRTSEVTAAQRALHTVLALSTGAWAGFVFFTGVNDWWFRATALAGTGYGRVSWLLTLYAGLVALSAAHDAFAAQALERRARYERLRPVRQPVTAR